MAISGAGGSAVNRIGSTTRAYVANTTDRGIKVDGDIDIIALDSASISSSVFAVSVAASFGASGVSVAVSVSLSDNSILSTVEAFTDRALLFSTEGSITLDARESASIDAASTAVAVALSVSVGAAVAGGGANAYNTIDTTTRAWSGRSTEDKVVNSITGLSELYALEDITVNALSASNANAVVKAAAASFGVVAAAAAGTQTRNTLSPVVDAFIAATEVKSPGTVLISARADQDANARSNALAISGGLSVSVGVSSVTTIDTSAINAAVGDLSQVQAGVLRVSAKAYDRIYQKSSASSGGLIAGAGALSDLSILGSTVAGIGKNATVEAGLVDLIAHRDQDFDSQAFNLAVGLFAGSGALVTNLVAGTADVKIGQGAQVDAESILIYASNQAVKNKYSALENSLESFSVSGASISAIASTTNVGRASSRFGSVVDIADDAALTVASDATGVFRVETLSSVKLIDKVRVDGLSGLGFTVALATQSTDSVSNIRVGKGASLRNLSGDLMMATRTDADVLAAANTFSLAAYGASNATALVTLNANNDIVLTDAELVGRDVKVMAGQSRDRVPNILLGKARADMAMIALFGITAPVRSVNLYEQNRVVLDGASEVRAIGSVDLLAEKGMGRAKLDGSVLNLSPGGIFSGLFPEGDEKLTGSNEVRVSNAARIEAGMNYKTVLSIQPYTVSGKPNLAGHSEAGSAQSARLSAIKQAGAAGVDLSKAEKEALGLDELQSYQYVALEMQQVAVSIGSGTIVELVGQDYGKGVSGAAYQLAPGSMADLNLVLDQEDYTNASRWTRIEADHRLGTTGSYLVAKAQLVRTSDGRWLRRTGDAVTVDAATESFNSSGWQAIQVQTSDRGKILARELSDDFYVVKPKAMALPTLVYANVANQLFEDRAKIVGWMSSHAGNAEAIARYQALLEKIDAQLEKMGLASKNSGVVVPRSQFDQIFLRLPKVEASAGLINILSDSTSEASIRLAQTSGRLLAHADANITIKNETPFGLEINNVGILKASRVDTLNGAQVTLSAGATYLNKIALNEPGPGGQSVINITQDAFPKEAYGVNGSLGALNAPSGPQDLYVRGKISNADGTLNLTNREGSIHVTGEIRAGAVNINAAGDFNLSTEDWFHTGADPRQYLDFNKVFGREVYREDGTAGTSLFGTADPRVQALLAAASGGAIPQTKEEEGNSTRASADVLTSNVAISAQLQDKFDQDFFKLSAAGAGRVTVALDTGLTASNTINFYELSLLDSTGKVLNTVQTGRNNSYSFNVGAAGDYYVRVSAVRTYPATTPSNPATTPGYTYTASDGKKTIKPGDTVLVKDAKNGDKVYVYDDNGKGNPVGGKERELDLTKTDQYADKDYWWQVQYNHRPNTYKITAVFTPPQAEPIKTIFAMGAIDINARYLNIDGTIQSGVDNITLNIAQDFAPSRSTNFTDALGKTLKGLDYGPAGFATVDGFFDANSGTIVLEDIKPTAGVINLTGTIISTGNGALKVASGYASININNQSRYALAAGLIDASENRVGKITVTDSTTLKREVYTFENGGYTQQQFQGTLVPPGIPGGVSSIRYDDRGLTGGRVADIAGSLIYQPEAGRYYVWTEGQAKTSTTLEYLRAAQLQPLGLGLGLPGARHRGQAQ